jgi:hypothetical protein
MSRALLTEFFPVAVSAAGRLFPGRFDQVFPREVLKECDAGPLWGIPLRWPGLIPPTLGGFLIGVRGGNSLRGSWSAAFYWFALMNLDAVLLHCVAPTAPAKRLALYFLDCISTGCSASSLVVAMLGNGRRVPKRLVAWWVLLVAATVVPDAAEAVYLVPLAAAGVALALQLRSATRYVVLALFFMAGTVVVTLFDAQLCRTLGPLHGYSIVWFFFGCDLAFASLFAWQIRELLREQLEKAKEE